MLLGGLNNLPTLQKVLHKRNSSEEFSILIESAKDELLDSEINSNNQLFIKNKERNINLLIKEFNRQKKFRSKIG